MKLFRGARRQNTSDQRGKVERENRTLPKKSEKEIERSEKEKRGRRKKKKKSRTFDGSLHLFFFLRNFFEVCFTLTRGSSTTKKKKKIIEKSPLINFIRFLSFLSKATSLCQNIIPFSKKKKKLFHFFFFFFHFSSFRSLPFFFFS